MSISKKDCNLLSKIKSKKGYIIPKYEFETGQIHNNLVNECSLDVELNKEVQISPDSRNAAPYGQELAIWWYGPCKKW